MTPQTIAAGPASALKAATQDDARRDSLLDFAKGIGIVLVVWGHSLQGIPQFDDNLAFRMLYAFHMPLFALLAGASARHWSQKISQATSAPLHAAVQRIGRSAMQLLLPFVAWTLINYWINPPPESLPAFGWKVLLRVDNSLWFLPCVFWCTTYLSLSLAGIATLRARLHPASKLRERLSSLPVQVLLTLLVWLVIRKRLPGAMGLDFVNFFHGGLFLFFLAGLLWFDLFSRTQKTILRVLPYLLFLPLAFWWHRTMDDHMIAGVPWLLTLRLVQKCYPLVVALGGALMVIDMARLIHSQRLPMLDRLMTYLGTASLAVYALHYKFLDYQPVVLAPIILSLMTYWLLSRIPILSRVLFGK